MQRNKEIVSSGYAYIDCLLGSGHKMIFYESGGKALNFDMYIEDNVKLCADYYKDGRIYWSGNEYEYSVKFLTEILKFCKNNDVKRKIVLEIK